MAFFLSLSLFELGTEVLAVMRPLAPFPDILPGEKSLEGEVEEEDGGDREEGFGVAEGVAKKIEGLMVAAGGRDVSKADGGQVTATAADANSHSSLGTTCCRIIIKINQTPSGNIQIRSEGRRKLLSYFIITGKKNGVISVFL